MARSNTAQFLLKHLYANKRMILHRYIFTTCSDCLLHLQLGHLRQLVRLPVQADRQPAHIQPEVPETSLEVFQLHVPPRRVGERLFYYIIIGYFVNIQECTKLRKY